MAFVNFSLLLGGAMMAIPVIVHLTMRRQPRHQLFPALQFLQERRDANRRKLELRHWLLLLLRCALIGLLAVALARPSVSTATFAQSLLAALVAAAAAAVVTVLVLFVRQGRDRLTIWLMAGLSALLALLLIGLLAVPASSAGGPSIGNRRAPVAAVLLVDTAPRMEYQFENQTRLATAAELAHWLLDQLPAESEVAVLETRPGPAVFAVDLSAAHSAIDRLRTSALAEPLAAAVRRGIELLETSTLPRKELYLFSDLAKSAWPATLEDSLQRVLADREDTTVHVIDVGVDEPVNVALGDLELSGEQVVAGSAFSIRTQVSSLGASKQQAIELLIERKQGDRPLKVDAEILLPELELRDQMVVDLAERESAEVVLRVSDLPVGVHHGRVRLAGSDGLAVDDVRYFSVAVVPPWQVLTVAPRGVNRALFEEAIAPTGYPSPFTLTTRNQEQNWTAGLDRYAVVCLLDPQPLGPAAAASLAGYAAGGGSVVFLLGHNARPGARFSQNGVADLLGATLTDVWRADDQPLQLQPTDYQHPVLAPFRQETTSIPWGEAPVFRHWMLGERAPAVRVIAPFSNRRAALIEHVYGKGRSLSLTTSVTDPLSPRGRPPWSELSTSENAWPYLILANEIVRYLADRDPEKRNLRVGAVADLPNEAETDPQRYRLFAPQQQPTPVEPQSGRVVIRDTEVPGVYYLKGNRDGPVLRGFSVNLPQTQTALERIDPTALSDFLPEARYFYARDRSEIQAVSGRARSGREFYPYLVTALVLVVALEHLLANRFYRGAA